jgi:hypothetical protein
MSWTNINTLAERLVAQHNPPAHERAMVEAMIADGTAKDPGCLGGPFLAQSIAELLTPMAA